MVCQGEACFMPLTHPTFRVYSSSSSIQFFHTSIKVSFLYVYIYIFQTTEEAVRRNWSGELYLNYLFINVVLCHCPANLYMWYHFSTLSLYISLFLNTKKWNPSIYVKLPYYYFLFFVYFDILLPKNYWPYFCLLINCVGINKIALFV